MAGYGVIPSIRVRNIPAALEFYTNKLGFELVRGGPEETNNSLKRGDSSIMLEAAGTFYTAAYNEAIRQRLGNKSATALYIEAEDLDELYAAAQKSGGNVIDPLAPREWGQTEFTIEDPEGNWLTFWKA